MSQVFYDQFLDLDDIDRKIKKVVKGKDEQIEFWRILDELIHYRVLAGILEVLPKEHYEEFALLLAKNPADGKILEFLKTKTKEDVGKIIKQTVLVLILEIMDVFSPAFGKAKK